MRHRLATPVALSAAVACFVAVFLITGSVLWSPLLAVAAAVGTYLMLEDRSDVRLRSDGYADEAERRVAAALKTLRDIERLGREVNAPAAGRALVAAAQHIPELFGRVRATAPDSLYSTASQIGAHLTSLDGAVRQYLDIQRKPLLYHHPEQLMRDGELAFQRFAEFALDSVRLVNQGDLAEYTANLQTVAPPTLPGPKESW